MVLLQPPGLACAAADLTVSVRRCDLVFWQREEDVNASVNRLAKLGWFGGEERINQLGLEGADRCRILRLDKRLGRGHHLANGLLEGDGNRWGGVWMAPEPPR